MRCARAWLVLGAWGALCAVTARDALAQERADAGASAPTQTSVTAASENHWPGVLPGLGVRADDPHDGRAWSLMTRVDPGAVTLTAATGNGALAVTFRHARQDPSGCSELLPRVMRVADPSSFRASHPVALRPGADVPLNLDVYRMNGSAFDAEFGCVHGAHGVWTVTALAQPRAGASLMDAEAMVRSVARALARDESRAEYPLALDASKIELPEPAGTVPWIYLGPAMTTPFPGDVLTSGAAEAGGVTLTVTRLTGGCAQAWPALRASLRNDAPEVDRPGYVPSAAGAKIRRVSMTDKTREFACFESARGAVITIAVFRTDDGDAMNRLGPMLSAVVRGAGIAPTRAPVPPAPTGRPR